MSADEVEPTEVDETDDFLGLSNSAPKAHQRKQVDESFRDFEPSNVQSSSTHSFTEDAGSFWDTNTGEDIDPAPTSTTPKPGSTSASHPDGIDSLLDGLGEFFQIKISQEVHDNVRSE